MDKRQRTKNEFLGNIPHTLTKQKAFKLFETSKNGLTVQEAQKRLEKFGKNELEQNKKTNKFVLFLKQFCDLMIVILFVAAIVSAVVALVQKNYSDLIDVAIILGIVFLNAVIGFIQENKAESSLEKLKKISEPYVKVVRDGQVTKILKTEVVVGDIILLEMGDIACADILLLEANSLKCNESHLTGESEEVLKLCDITKPKDTPLAERNNIVFANSSITYGRGLGLVVRTGMDTEIGKIATLLTKEKKEQTPLERKLGFLGKFLTFSVLIIAVVIFVLSISIDPSHDFMKPLLLAIAVAVAAIPESLPSVITIIMALGTNRLAKKNAIIKKLHAVETLGSCQIICSDKTGTLTQNRMKVEGVFCDGKLLEGDKLIDAKNNKHFLNSLALCNDCITKLDKILGDPTEVALVEFVAGLGMSKQNFEQKYIRVAELPFDSNRKLMTTYNLVEKGVIAYTKGAPDILISRCNKILKDEKISKLDETEKQEIEKLISKMASKGLRTLAFAYKKHTSEKYELENENELIFLGFVAMRDPPRETTNDAVRVCKNSGMKPIMITGDHAITAKAIAKEVGIWESDSLLLTGKELDALTDAQYRKIINRVSVYARVSPEHKVRIVNMWKSFGHVVAMTGDGVNDAPSIKAADIGIGMGQGGTEVTKEVADMVLTDDNFSTIIIAVKEGRRIYHNIQKVIQFLLGTNFVEVASILIATIFCPQLIFLLPLQILFINMITDSLPAIALSVEEAEPDIMNEKPRSKTENIFGGGMWQKMVVQMIYQTILVVLTFVITYNLTQNNTLATTFAFVTLSLSQLFHIINVKSSQTIFRKHGLKNTLMWVSIILGLLLNVLVVSIPQIAEVFGLVPLLWWQWLVVVGLSLTIIPIMEVYKFIVKKIKQSKQNKN